MFGEDGRIVGSAMSSVGAGLWPSYESLFRDRLKVELQRADVNPCVRGYHADGTSRRRLGAFVELGITTQFVSLGTTQEKAVESPFANSVRRVATNSLLFDPAT